jgi:hypothetical protein
LVVGRKRRPVMVRSTSKKVAAPKVKLPQPKAKPPKGLARQAGFEVLNPGGDEIYKMSARYPTQPPLGPCTFRVFWKGGPSPANINIYLIDIKHWVAIAVVASNIANVPPGEIGMVPWTIPANFRPSDDCDTPSTYPLKYGRYQIYIEEIAQLTWTYGPEFAITWSE